MTANLNLSWFDQRTDANVQSEEDFPYITKLQFLSSDKKLPSANEMNLFTGLEELSFRGCINISKKPFGTSRAAANKYKFPLLRVIDFTNSNIDQPFSCLPDELKDRWREGDLEVIVGKIEETRQTVTDWPVWWKQSPQYTPKSPSFVIPDLTKPRDFVTSIERHAREKEKTYLRDVMRDARDGSTWEYTELPKIELLVSHERERLSVEYRELRLVTDVLNELFSKYRWNTSGFHIDSMGIDRVINALFRYPDDYNIGAVQPWYDLFQALVREDAKKLAYMERYDIPTTTDRPLPDTYEGLMCWQPPFCNIFDHDGNYPVALVDVPDEKETQQVQDEVHLGEVSVEHVLGIIQELANEAGLKGTEWDKARSNHMVWFFGIDFSDNVCTLGLRESRRRTKLYSPRDDAVGITFGYMRLTDFKEFVTALNKNSMLTFSFRPGENYLTLRSDGMNVNLLYGEVKTYNLPCPSA